MEGVLKELICIVCPRGCRLAVDENNDYAVTGHGCNRGEEYGKAELKNPVRTLTSTVRITGAELQRCPVKTKGVIPKRMLLEAVRLLDKIELTAPVYEGQIIISDICGTGIPFVATRDIITN